MTEQLNSARLAAKRLSCKLLTVAAMALSFNSFLPAQAEEIIWRAFNESGSKFFDEHDYEKAEQSLLNAVKEAEKIDPQAPELKTSLALLRKVYLALGNSAKAEVIAARLEALGSSDKGSETASGDPSQTAGEIPPQSEQAKSEPVSKAQIGESEEAKSLSRTGSKAEAAPETPPAVKSEFREAAKTVPTSDAPTQIASVRGIAGELKSGGIVKKAEELFKMTGHISWTKGLAISADGNRALSGSDDDSVRLWDLSAGKELKRFDGHEENVNSVCFSPSSNTGMSASGDSSVRIWDLDSGAQLKKLVGHGNIVLACAYSPSGNKAVSCGYDGTVRIWDVLNGTQLQLCQGQGTIRCVAFSPDGEQVASGGSDKVVTLWRVRDGSVIRRFTGHRGDVTTVGFSADGSKLLTASRDLTIRTWDVGSGSELKQFIGHGDWVCNARFIKSDSKVASGSLDKTFRVWDVEQGTETCSFTLNAYGMFGLAFTPSGENALTGSNDYSLRYWKLIE